MNDLHSINHSVARRRMLVVAALVIALSSAAAGYWFAQHRATEATDPSAGTERKVLYWYDPMVPNQHFDKPGKSPFMDMQLVPKYADEAKDTNAVQIDPRLVQNLGVRLTSVERGSLSRALNLVGTINFNQRHIAVVQARANGFVTRVYARAPGDVIERGAPLVDLLVPEWAGAQAEFLALLASGDRELIDAARERLVLLGMPPSLITAIESDRRAHTTTTVRAPIGGAIEQLGVRQGMTVSTGATLATINGLETVWLEGALPEAQAALVEVGQSVDAHLNAYPGETFTGRVIAVLPQADVETRTVQVRIELPNKRARLRPGMFAQIQLRAEADQSTLWVASEAVIHTGRRNVVIVSDGEGHFIPTEVQTGAEADGKTPILDGLTEGQKVVASGQFLIDSEASLSGVLARLAASASP